MYFIKGGLEDLKSRFEQDIKVLRDGAGGGY
jgi:hypothetical protein